ncbi:MAG: sucrase ferredoxin [Corynebacterium sp.]|nr:sucrase ferredoxin [Corynebacterium sp.]
MTFCSAIRTEPLPGTTKTAHRYVLLEYTASWGDDIATTLSEQELALLKPHGTPFLIRKPGVAGHAPLHERRVYIVDAHDRTTVEYRINSLAQLADLPEGAPVTQPLALVCTHAKRDRCCAIEGRPIAAALEQAFPQAPIWECSHTKGHRFAPSIVLLPSGHSFGHLDAAQAIEMYTAAQADQLYVTGNRGRSIYSAAEQVVEMAVAEYLRQQGQQVGLADIQVAGKQAEVRGQRYTVVLKEETASFQPSCGKPLKEGKHWVAVSVQAV